MKEIRIIKQLESQLKNIEADAECLRIESINKQREYSRKLGDIERLKKEISKLNNDSKIKVSEHAIVRYFERVKGYDIASIEKDILSDRILILVEKLGGNGTYPNDGYSVIIKNNTVTTITK